MGALLVTALFIDQACAQEHGKDVALDVPPNCTFNGTYEVVMKLLDNGCASGSCEPGAHEFLDTSDLDHPLDEHMEPSGEHCDRTDGKGHSLAPHIFVTSDNGDDHCVLEWNRVCHLDGVFDSRIGIYATQDIGDQLWTGSATIDAKLVASGDTFSGVYGIKATRPVDAPIWSISEPLTYSTNVTTCELSTAQAARNAWIARYPNAFPSCVQWSYNTTSHTSTAFYGSCPQYVQSEAIYGNAYIPGNPRAWRWIGTVGAGHVYQCSCAEVGGGVSCGWVS